MSKAAAISGRGTEETSAKLDCVAARLNRPRGWIVARAIKQLVLSERAPVDSLDEADRRNDGGEYPA